MSEETFNPVHAFIQTPNHYLFCIARRITRWHWTVIVEIPYNKVIHYPEKLNYPEHAYLSDFASKLVHTSNSYYHVANQMYFDGEIFSIVDYSGSRNGILITLEHLKLINTDAAKILAMKIALGL